MSNESSIFLVIDDDATLLNVMVRSLTRRGFTVLAATNGEQAITLCKQHSPHYISLDLKLENESGLHLITALKQYAPYGQIVMLTSYASIATAVDAIKLGAQQYLCKPVDIDELLNAFEHPSHHAADALLSNTDNQHCAITKNTNITNTEIAEQPTSVKRLEWEKIQQTLQANDGNISVTARKLGMHRRTLQRKLQKHPVKH